MRQLAGREPASVGRAWSVGSLGSSFAPGWVVGEPVGCVAGALVGLWVDPGFDVGEPVGWSPLLPGAVTVPQ